MVEDVSLYLSSEDHVLASLKQSKGQWEENQGSENQRGSGHGHTWGTQQGGHSFSFVLTFCLFLCFLLVCLFSWVFLSLSPPSVSESSRDMRRRFGVGL